MKVASEQIRVFPDSKARILEVLQELKDAGNHRATIPDAVEEIIRRADAAQEQQEQ